MTKSKNRQAALPLLDVGDLIKTHPHDEYWGAAVVLSVCTEGGFFARSCHIGITPAVFRHDYALDELNIADLSILECHRGVRIAPLDYGQRRETCIGIYGRAIKSHTCVLGRVDIAHIETPPLSFQVGNGSDGGWPLCDLNGRFGSEAIDEWRRVHDSARYLDEARKAALSHETMLLNSSRHRK